MRNKVSDLMASTSSKLIVLLCSISLSFFFVLSLFFSSTLRFSDGKVLFFRTPLKTTLFVLIVFISFSYLLTHLASVHSVSSGYPHLLRNCMLVCIFVESILSVLIINHTPIDDQKNVMDSAAALLNGDYSPFQKGGLAYTWSNLTSLILIVSKLSFIFGEQNHIAFQLMNALFVFGIWYILSLFVFRITENIRLQLLVLLFGILFQPLPLYCTFVYGTIPGLFFSLAAMYQEYVFFKEENIHNLFSAALLILLAVLMKQNYLIAWIAMVIYAFLFLLVKHNIKQILALFLLLPVIFLQSFIPAFWLKKETGLEMSSGPSPLSWVVMGLSEDGYSAPGWYDSYNYYSYIESGYDKENQAQMSLQEINTALTRLSNNPSEGIKFFLKKTVSMWCQPSFEAISIQKEIFPSINKAEWLSKLFSLKGSLFFSRYMQFLQILIYSGCLLWLLFSKNDLFSPCILLLLNFLGVFLFHLFWEAKAQYSLPAFVGLIPVSVIGWQQGYALVKRTFSKENHLKASIEVSFPSLIGSALASVCLIFLFAFGFTACLSEDQTVVNDTLSGKDVIITDGVYTFHPYTNPSLGLQVDQEILLKENTYPCTGMNVVNNGYDWQITVPGRSISLSGLEKDASVFLADYQHLSTQRWILNNYHYLEKNILTIQLKRTNLCLSYDIEDGSLKLKDFDESDPSIFWMLEPAGKE